MSDFLTRDDFKELTGYSNPAKVIDALRDMGFRERVHFWVRPDGKPRMTWAALKPWHDKPTTEGPRLELINGQKASTR